MSDAPDAVCGATRDLVTIDIGGTEVRIRHVCQLPPGHYDPDNNQPHGFYAVWTDEEEEGDGE